MSDVLKLNKGDMSSVPKPRLTASQYRAMRNLLRERIENRYGANPVALLNDLMKVGGFDKDLIDDEKSVGGTAEYWYHEYLHLLGDESSDTRMTGDSFRLWAQHGDALALHELLQRDCPERLIWLKIELEYYVKENERDEI